MTVVELHQEAIERVEKAFEFRVKGKCDAYVSCIRRAFLVEKQAALLAIEIYPTAKVTPIICRTAISLANECGMNDVNELQEYLGKDNK